MIWDGISIISPHAGLCDEAEQGLHELEAAEVALIFKQARRLIEPEREKILELKKADGKAFSEWYVSSELEAALNPLNKQLWNICDQSPDYGILHFWLSYARKFPERGAG